MSRFEIQPTSIDGVCIATRKPIADDRGCFERMFCVNDLQSILAGRSILQMNRTLTKSQGTIRGMHYQRPPHAEMKLISCLRGEVMDVAVDLRPNSTTFMKSTHVILSPENANMMIIPEGCAHGFQTLTADCELLYLHTAIYNGPCEAGINAIGGDLDIDWPLPVNNRSTRDQNLPLANLRLMETQV